MLFANAALFLFVSLAPSDDVLTPKNVATIRAVSSAQISPDAKRVAFVKLVPREAGVDEDGTPWNELWVTDFSGAGKEMPFVTGKVNVSAIEWTKDGTGIAFLAKRGDDKNTALYVIPADGGEAKRILSLASDISAYSFSPDGKRVAVVAAEPMPEAKKKLEEKGFKQEVYEEDWRLDRVWIAELGETTGEAALAPDRDLGERRPVEPGRRPAARDALADAARRRRDDADARARRRLEDGRDHRAHPEPGQARARALEPGREARGARLGVGHPRSLGGTPHGLRVERRGAGRRPSGRRGGLLGVRMAGRGQGARRRRQGALEHVQQRGDRRLGEGHAEAHPRRAGAGADVDLDLGRRAARCLRRERGHASDRALHDDARREGADAEDGQQPVAREDPVRGAGDRPVEGARRPRPRGRARAAARREEGRALPPDPVRARRSRIARRRRLADRLQQARADRGRAGDRDVLPELPREHGTRRRVLPAIAGRSGREGVRRPRRRGRPSRGERARGQGQGRRDRRLVRRLRDRVVLDEVLGAVRGRRHVRRDQRQDLEGRDDGHLGRGLLRPLDEAPVGRLGHAARPEPDQARGPVQGRRS